MPLNRPALTLGSGPRGVHDARRWVVRTCSDIGRDDLIECAELGVSELVTNALLHGEPPIQVRVRGTAEHPRIEVRDSSLEAPILPTAAEMDEHDELLLTYGRGLGLVARGADAWGAEIEDDGKVVWFAPAGQFAEDHGVPGLITGVDGVRARREPTHDRVRVQILGVPLQLYIEFQQHFRELRREVRLLSLAHESDYPLAKSLSDLFATLDRHLREGIGIEQIEAAVADDRTHTDLVVHMPRAHRADPEPVHRAARPGRRLLPPAAPARAGTHRRAASLPGLVPLRVRQPGRRRGAAPVDRPRPEPAHRRLLTYLCIGLGGALGALLRWWLGDVATDGVGFPWTTFMINVSGCFALACLTVLAAVRARPALAAALGPGFLGGYTTMSAAADETRVLLADDRVLSALLYAGGTLSACLVAVLLAERISGRPPSAPVVEP